MINGSEMKTKKEKIEKLNFVCMPNLALHLKREIRPNVVLECSFWSKNVLETRERERERT